MAVPSLGDRIRTNVFGIDMREHFVIDPLIGKRQQLMLATQLCRMVLKVRYAALSTQPNDCSRRLQVNNVIIAGSGENEF